MSHKVPFPLDKRVWHPSPLAGQVMLVTTLNSDGTSNIAPKSWVSMMTFQPSLLALGCNRNHWTGRNVIRDGEFVVNVPGAELAETVWRCHTIPHPRPVEAAGLTPLPALEVRPHRVAECKAHLECRLDRRLDYGDEVVFLGRIVAASVDREALESPAPYEYLRLFTFLEEGLYGVIERAARVGSGDR